MSTNTQTITERNAVILKVVAITVLIILLLIPTSMIRGLISERQQRQNEAVEEVSAKWGHEQVLTGPILTIPYQTFDFDKQGEKINITTHYAYYLPEKLNISGKINPEIRYRGIFQVAVYNSKLNFKVYL